MLNMANSRHQHKVAPHPFPLPLARQGRGYEKAMACADPARFAATFRLEVDHGTRVSAMADDLSVIAAAKALRRQVVH